LEVLGDALVSFITSLLCEVFISMTFLHPISPLGKSPRRLEINLLHQALEYF
jgi:hypothetical protein